MRLLIVFFFILAMTAPDIARAHSGRVNPDGGHKNKATGEYHFHKKHAGTKSPYRKAIIKVGVMRVIDGDTFVARFPDGEVEKVRLRNFNAPEKGEKGFKRATDSLKSRIGNKTIEIKVGIHKKRGNYLRGYYGRVLGDIIGDARERKSP